MRIRRLFFNGLHRRNSTDSALLGMLCLSVPFAVLWIPELKPQPIDDFVLNLIGLSLTVIMAFTAMGGFTRKREDSMTLLAAFALIFGARIAYHEHIVSLAPVIGVNILACFLAMRSMANAVTRNHALDTLTRVHLRSWGITETD